MEFGELIDADLQGSYGYLVSDRSDLERRVNSPSCDVRSNYVVFLNDSVKIFR